MVAPALRGWRPRALFPNRFRFAQVPAAVESIRRDPCHPHSARRSMDAQQLSPCLARAAESTRHIPAPVLRRVPAGALAPSSRLSPLRIRQQSQRQSPVRHVVQPLRPRSAALPGAALVVRARLLRREIPATRTGHDRHGRDGVVPGPRRVPHLRPAADGRAVEVRLLRRRPLSSAPPARVLAFFAAVLRAAAPDHLSVAAVRAADAAVGARAGGLFDRSVVRGFRLRLRTALLLAVSAMLVAPVIAARSIRTPASLTALRPLTALGAFPRHLRLSFYRRLCRDPFEPAEDLADD